MQKSCDDPILILASKSPRRKYLLEQAGLCFSVIPSGFDERSVSLSLSETYVPETYVPETYVPETYVPETYVKVLAEKKAHNVSKRYPENWVIGADTIVLIGSTVLGKPGSKAEAKSMLKCLGGQVHQVLTGYCICCEAKNKCFSETIKTEVLFKNLADEEIEWYINTNEPFDKAGAYAIQGLGTFLVKSINGSYTNVVGLPVCEVIEFLIKEGVVARSREQGAKSREQGAKSMEQGAKSKEQGAGSKEQRARSMEHGAKSMEHGARSKEQGAGSREQGARSKEQGAGSREQGARSMEHGAGSMEQGAGSKEQGARSREQGAWSREQGARSKEHGAGSREQGLLIEKIEYFGSSA